MSDQTSSTPPTASTSAPQSTRPSIAHCPPSGWQRPPHLLPTSPPFVSDRRAHAPHTPASPDAEDGESDGSPCSGSSTAPTVIVPTGPAVGPSSSCGFSPDSLSHRSDSPFDASRSSPRLSRAVHEVDSLATTFMSTTTTTTMTTTATTASARAVVPAMETTVLYTLVPEADVPTTQLVTPPSPAAPARPLPPPPLPRQSQPPMSTVPFSGDAKTGEVVHCAVTKTDKNNHNNNNEDDEEDKDKTDETPPLIFREAPLVDPLWARSTAARATTTSTVAKAAVTEMTFAAPLLASLPLDADKTSYEALCATGVTALFATPPETSSAEVRGEGPPSRKRARSPTAAITTTITTTTADTTPRSVWQTGEQVEARALQTEMSPVDVDARLDVLEEVQLAQLALFLPRTFPLYRLVSQVVPTAVWLSESPASTTELSEAEACPAASPRLRQAAALAFVETLTRTHRAHVLSCLVEEKEEMEVEVDERRAAERDGSHSEDEGRHASAQEGDDLLTPESNPHSAGEHATPPLKKDVTTVKEEAAEKSELAMSSVMRLAAAERHVIGARQTHARAARRARHCVTHGGRGTLVEWQDGTVGYTPDLDGLFDEEHIRQTRLFHPLPSLPASSASSGRVPCSPNGHGRAVKAHGHCAMTLRDAAVTQQQRLRAFEVARSAFVHARTGAPPPPPSSHNKAKNDDEEAVPPTSCSEDDMSVQSTRPCACPLCVEWQPQFAQVQLPPAGLERYLDHLHGASAVSLSTATAALHAGLCVPLKGSTSQSFVSARLPHTNSTTGSATFTRQPVLPGLRRELMSTSSCMLSYPIAPAEIFPALSTAPSQSAPATTTTATGKKTTSAPRTTRTSRPAPSRTYAWLDDAVLDEAVLVGIAPRHQPYALELVPPSLAFRRLLLTGVMAHVGLYTQTVLPLVRSRRPATSAWLARQYRTALATALEAALYDEQDGTTAEEHGNGDAVWLRVHVLPLLLPTTRTTATTTTTCTGDEENDLSHHVSDDHVDDDDDDEEEGEEESRAEKAALASLMARVAAQHVESLIASTADSIVRVLLDALRTVLYRRTFTMYEMLRLLSSKALFLAHRQLVTRYKEWYAQTPSPGAILRLVQRSSRFGPALVRLFPHLIRSSPLSADAEVKPEVRRQAHDEAPADAHDESDEAAADTAAVWLDFVPEAALLEPSYLLRFTLWVLETYHGNGAQTSGMGPVLVDALAAVTSAPVPLHAPRGVPTMSTSGVADEAATVQGTDDRSFVSLFPLTRPPEEPHETEAKGGESEVKTTVRTADAADAYSTVSYPFLVPHCPTSVDPALSQVLVAVGLRGRTFLAEEMDRYVNTLVTRGDR